MWGAAQRFIEQGHRDGRYIIYLGDHDPSGVDMTRDIQDRMFMFGADVDHFCISKNNRRLLKMTIFLNDVEYRLPPINAVTLRKLKQVSGAPMAQMDPYTIMQSLIAVAAGVSFAEAGELWESNKDKCGADAANQLIVDMADDLTRQINDKKQWLSRRSPKVREKWLLAYKEGK